MTRLFKNVFFLLYRYVRFFKHGFKERCRCNVLGVALLSVIMLLSFNLTICKKYFYTRFLWFFFFLMIWVHYFFSTVSKFQTEVAGRAIYTFSHFHRNPAHLSPTNVGGGVTVFSYLVHDDGIGWADTDDSGGEHGKWKRQRHGENKEEHNCQYADDVGPLTKRQPVKKKLEQLETHHKKLVICHKRTTRPSIRMYMSVVFKKKIKIVSRF